MRTNLIVTKQPVERESYMCLTELSTIVVIVAWLLNSIASASAHDINMLFTCFSSERINVDYDMISDSSVLRWKSQLGAEKLTSWVVGSVTTQHIVKHWVYRWEQLSRHHCADDLTMVGFHVSNILQHRLHFIICATGWIWLDGAVYVFMFSVANCIAAALVQLVDKSESTTRAVQKLKTWPLVSTFYTMRWGEKVALNPPFVDRQQNTDVEAMIQDFLEVNTSPQPSKA